MSKNMHRNIMFQSMESTIYMSSSRRAPFHMTLNSWSRARSFPKQSGNLIKRFCAMVNCKKPAQKSVNHVPSPENRLKCDGGVWPLLSWNLEYTNKTFSFTWIQFEIHYRWLFALFIHLNDHGFRLISSIKWQTKVNPATKNSSLIVVFVLWFSYAYS